MAGAVHRVLRRCGLLAALWVAASISVLEVDPALLRYAGLGIGLGLTRPPFRDVYPSGPVPLLDALLHDPALPAVVAGLLLPLLVARRHPQGAALCVVTAFAVVTLLRIPPLVAGYALPVVLALAARRSRHRRRLVIILIVAASALVTVLAARGDVVPVGGGAGPGPGQLAIGEVGITLGLLAGAWWIGTGLRRRDENTALLADRVAHQQRMHELEADAARQQERLRIARELHDVLGHSLTAVPLLAEAVRRGLPAPLSAPVDVALTRLAAVGTDGASEVRRTLHLLRQPSVAPPATTSDGPAGLPALAEHLRGLGHRVTTDLDRDPEVPAPIRAAVFRIVQESLTNTVRHAPGAEVSLSVRCTPTEVRVLVEDRGATPSPRSGPAAAAAAGGRGILGMTERAALLGGTLHAGPPPDGPGWRVCARLPRHDPEP